MGMGMSLGKSVGACVRRRVRRLLFCLLPVGVLLLPSSASFPPYAHKPNLLSVQNQKLKSHPTSTPVGWKALKNVRQTDPYEPQCNGQMRIWHQTLKARSRFGMDQVIGFGLDSLRNPNIAVPFAGGRADPRNIDPSFLPLLSPLHASQAVQRAAPLSRPLPLCTTTGRLVAI